MNFKNKRENMIIYIKLIRKKIKDMSLKKKLNIFLFSVTICACLAMGIISYRISSKAMISNSETMAVNLMKQIGLNLDERIETFRDISYRILQTTSVNQILQYNQEEAIVNKTTANNAFNTVILQQTSLYSYTKYALLRPDNGVITEYYRSRVRTLDVEKEQEILDYLDEYVTVLNPTNWVRYDDQIYFVRKIVNSNGKESGILCFAMTNQFFSFVGTDQDYLSNDNIVIVESGGDILKQDMEGIGEEQIRKISQYKNSQFYVYTSQTNVNGKRYVVTALNTTDHNWSIIGFMQYEMLLKDLNQISFMIVGVIILILAIGMIVTSLISKTVNRNVALIEQGMKNFESGRFDVKIKPANYDEIGRLALQMNYMAMRISNLIVMVEREESAKRESEYKTLEAQINPHFLYNTLGSIKWAAFRKEETETAQAIDALINLLRFTIKKASKLLPLQEEIEYIKNYIAIEKVRYGDGFHMLYEIEEQVFDWSVPGFILQPFIENSLIHGLDMAGNNPCIVLRAYLKSGLLHLEVEDNGIGMSEETIKSIWMKTSSETSEKGYSGFNSIGIQIVDARLHSYYGERYQTNIYSKIGVGTRIELIIPEIEVKESV